MDPTTTCRAPPADGLERVGNAMQAAMTKSRYRNIDRYHS